MVHGHICVRAVREQQLYDLDAIAGRSQMQGCVTDLEPVKDFLIVESGFTDTCDDKRRIDREHILDCRAVVIKNGSKECVHSFLVLIITAISKESLPAIRQTFLAEAIASLTVCQLNPVAS